MAQVKNNGLTITGRLKQSGISLYVRNGKTVVRSATSLQPHSRTRKQFVARQQMSHSCRLWTILKDAGEPLFIASPSAYTRFLSLMRRTPVVFLPKRGATGGGTLLLPDTPVSDGILPIVKQHLGEVDGVPALVTDLLPSDLHRRERLLFYTLHQTIEGRRPTVRVSRREVTVGDMVETASGLALTGNEFADDMTGWALVRISGSQCSSQSVVTRCIFYQQYTTEEALQAAAQSYGGLTDK